MNANGVILSSVYQLVVKLGNRYATSSPEDRKAIAVALDILTHARLCDDDGKAQRLISMARMISKRGKETDSEIQEP